MGGAAHAGILTFSLTRSPRFPSSLILANRDGKSLSGGPSISQAIPYSACANSGFFGPFSHCLDSPVKSEATIDSFIVLLFWRLGPLTVAKRIAKIVIYSLKGMSGRWPWPHVGKKHLEVIPLRAKFYTSSTVVSISRILNVIAPIFHVLPRRVFRGARHTVFCHASFNPFTLIASTRNASTVFQRKARDGFLCSAIASAIPKVSSSVSVREVKHEPTAKPMACNVFHLHG